MSTAMTFSIGRNKNHANDVRQVNGEFDDLADAVLSTTHVGKDGPYVCAPLRDGRRNTESVLPVAFVALDLDKISDGLVMSSIISAAEAWQGFGYTTSSHAPDAGRFKMRLFFALDRVVSRDEYGNVCRALAARLQALAGVPVEIDTACKKPEQPLYTARAGATVWRFGGMPIPVDELLIEAPPGDRATQVWGEQQGRPGGSYSEWLNDLLRGESVHDNALRLVGRMVAKGLDDETIKAWFAGVAPRVAGERGIDRAQELTGSELERMIAGARQKGFAPNIVRVGLAPEVVAAPKYASLVDLDFNPPPPRQWVIDEWLPRATVTALFGGGGVGKSLLIQQMATCIANGIEIFGATVSKGPVLAYLCEDDNDEIRRRQVAILAELGRSPAVSADDLHIEGRAGLENLMVTFGPDRLPVLGQFMAMVERECVRVRPVVLMLDNIAQLFGGVENDRYLVTAFANQLAGIAHRYDCAVLLLGHVAKMQGSEYSGSTAWEAAVRTRLWMERREDGLIELHRRKANYAGQASVVLEYQHGALVEIDGKDNESAAVRTAEGQVLKALETFTTRQTATSHQPTARNNLVSLAAKMGLLTVPTSIASRALNALIDDGRILPNTDLGWRKPDRHRAFGLALAPEAEAAA